MGMESNVNYASICALAIVKLAVASLPLVAHGRVESVFPIYRVKTVVLINEFLFVEVVVGLDFGDFRGLPL